MGLQPPLAGLQDEGPRVTEGPGSHGPRDGAAPSPRAQGGRLCRGHGRARWRPLRPRGPAQRREAPGAARSHLLAFLALLLHVSGGGGGGPGPPRGIPAAAVLARPQCAAGPSSPASLPGGGHSPPCSCSRSRSRSRPRSRPEPPQRHQQLFNPAAILGGGFPACTAPRPPPGGLTSVLPGRAKAGSRTTHAPILPPPQDRPAPPTRRSPAHPNSPIRAV